VCSSDLTRELCEELHLFAYEARGTDYVVIDIADEEGWKAVRDELAGSAGIGGIPVIHPKTVEKGRLILEHSFDGRELDLNYARETLKYTARLWGDAVELITNVGGKETIIASNEDKAARAGI
jgi:stage V sporulation protein R